VEQQHKLNNISTFSVLSVTHPDYVDNRADIVKEIAGKENRIHQLQEELVTTKTEQAAERAAPAQ
jgi:hypothetical protein